MAERGLAAFLSVHPANVRYLTGFTGSSGFLLVGTDGAGLVTDFRYREQASEEVPDGLPVWIHGDGWREEVAARLPSVIGDSAPGDSRAVGFESDRMTVRDRERLEEAAPDARWSGVSGLVEDLRARKSDDEVERIRRAARLGDRVLETFLEEVAEGATETELAAELDYRLRLAGSEGVAFDTIVAGGPRSALPHARPSRRTLGEGDLLLVDFGARAEGYCSDMTRVFCLGPPEEWQRSLHRSVLRAQRAALDRVEPGVEAAAVDAAAREALEADGLADHFGHSAGHGIGLEVHEGPAVSRRSDDRLQEGHVITVEPGAYLEGRGGVRIEDDVVVRAGGAEVLTGFPRELREL